MDVYNVRRELFGDGGGRLRSPRGAPMLETVMSFRGDIADADNLSAVRELIGRDVPDAVLLRAIYRAGCRELLGDRYRRCHALVTPCGQSQPPGVTLGAAAAEPRGTQPTAQH